MSGLPGWLSLFRLIDNLNRSVCSGRVIPLIESEDWVKLIVKSVSGGKCGVVDLIDLICEDRLGSIPSLPPLHACTRIKKDEIALWVLDASLWVESLFEIGTSKSKS